MIEIYCLRNCFYCDKSLKLLQVYKIPYKLTWVTDSDKIFFKKQHNMNTFPQIFYLEKSKKIKIGGNEQLEYLISILDMIYKFKFDLKIINGLMKYVS